MPSLSKTWRNDKIRNEKVSANRYKKRHAQKSHADIGYRKATKMESILSWPKLEHRVMLHRNENSADCLKQMTIDHFSLRSLPAKTKILQNI